MKNIILLALLLSTGCTVKLESTPNNKPPRFEVIQYLPTGQSLTNYTDERITWNEKDPKADFHDYYTGKEIIIWGTIRAREQ